MSRIKVLIIIRVYYFLCFLGFRGVGYSKEFVENFERVYKSVYFENLFIKIVFFLDEICRCCLNLNIIECRFE